MPMSAIPCRDHPDFFIGKTICLGRSCAFRTTPALPGLVERQLAVHRQRNVELRQRLSDLLENARRNDQLFGKSRRLVLALTEAEKLAGHSGRTG